MQRPHITVCVCSFKRPHLLEQTLRHLRDLNTSGCFSYSIVVADNDRAETARSVVAAFAQAAPMAVHYCVEPEQNISLARNKALELAEGEYIAWIDDDEFPERDWLLHFFRTLEGYGADGVLGPVRPVFETPPPDWIVKGRFFEKPRRVTGLKLRWSQTSTANVLIRRRILNGVQPVFRRQFGSGCEDIDFFKRMTERGHVFVWCEEAIVSEFVPPARWNSRYLFRRALLRGRNGHHFADLTSVVKSIIALPCYVLLLPFLFLAGYHHFVRYLMKIGDHAGKLFGKAGVNVLGDKYHAA